MASIKIASPGAPQPASSYARCRGLGEADTSYGKTRASPLLRAVCGASGVIDRFTTVSPARRYGRILPWACCVAERGRERERSTVAAGLIELFWGRLSYRQAFEIHFAISTSLLFRQTKRPYRGSPVGEPKARLDELPQASTALPIFQYA